MYKTEDDLTRAALREALAMAAKERDRVNYLTDKMLAMRLENGGDPVFPDVPVEKDSLEGSIRSAINDVEPEEQEYLEEYAKNQIAAGVSESDIANAITAGLQIEI